MEKMAQSMKLKNKERQLIKKFLLAINNCFSTIDERTFWPANAAQIEAYFSDIIALDLFCKFKENPQNFKKALSRLSCFSLYESLYHKEIIGLKVNRIYLDCPKNKKDIINFVMSFFEVIKSKVKGEIFCLDGTHRLLTNTEVKEIEKNKRWMKAENYKTKRLISNFISCLENLVWAFYFDIFVSTGREIHGPYFINKNEVILVRDYYNLNPKEIWGIDNKYQSLKIFLKYPKECNIQLNYANQVKSSKPLGENLISFSIEVNRKPVKDLHEIFLLFKYFLRLGEKQANKVNKLSPLEIVKKGAEIYYYRYKELYKFYKEDWRPPRVVYQRINTLKLKWLDYFKSDNYKRKEPRFYVNLLDPTNNFIG
jgi:hypothetical protein